MLMVADIDKKKIRNVVTKTCTERRRISLLKDSRIMKRLEEKVIYFADVRAPNMWGHYKNGDLKACHEVCEKKRGKRNKGDTWLWNEEVKEVESRKKDSDKVVHWNSTEENKRYKSMKK